MQLPATTSLSNYHFMWCSVVINVIINTAKPLSIVSERTAKNKRQMWENDRGRKVIYLELFGENCMQIITKGQIFLLNYKLSRFSK
jgi:hypothetical protein